jgi:polyisoprenyl-teichoic acid--peptidoglycan teichoic acid transferase
MRGHVVRRRLLIALAAFVAVVLVGGIGAAVFVGTLQSEFDNGRTVIPDASAFPAQSLRPPQASGTAGQAQNILLLGTDTRGSNPTSLAAIRAQRSDTMMIVHVPANRKHVYVVSVMRDSWVTIPGYAHAKINAALSYGGVPLVVQTLEDLMHLRIDHVAVVSFSGFSGLTDALGGVTVDNSVAFSERGATFSKGEIRLDGKDALIYVRARYPFPDGDYQRIRDQQAYLKGVIHALLTPGTLLDPIKVNNTVKAVAPYLLVDKGLDAGYVGSMALSMRSLHQSDIHFFSAPTTGTSTIDGQSVVLLDQPKLAELAKLLREDRVDQYSPCTGDFC